VRVWLRTYQTAANQDDGKVDHRRVAEQDGADNGDLLHCLREDVPNRGDRRAGILHAQQSCEAQAKERQCQPRRDLVRQKNLRQDPEDGSEDHATAHSRDERKNDGIRFHRDDEAGDGAHDHHPLHAEIENAGLLDNKLADCGQQNRGGRDDQRDDEGDGIDDHAASARFSRMR
jgi:hypothetical protein